MRALSRLLPLLPVACLTLVASVPAAGGARQVALLHPPPWVDAGVQRLRSEVSIRIDGGSRVARLEIQEEFRNGSGTVLEGDYLYPVPPGAVFENLSLFAGETELRGEMLPAEQARAIYEDIVRRRKDPALVELIGHGLIRARVFPIEPGATRKIILRFTQLLPRDGSVVRLRYPRAASLIVPSGSFIEPRPAHMPEAHPEAHAATFALRVRIDDAARFGTPLSPTSRIDVSRPSAEVIDVVLRDVGVDGQFELLLPLLREQVGVDLLAHSPDPGSEDGYFMMLISPPAGEPRARIGRDVTLVLDVSGSMSGHKIEQARAALEQTLRSLRSDDRFRLITFASAVRAWEHRFADASAVNVEAAVQWLRATPADGSTNLSDALRAALEPITDRERLSLVLLLSDGVPTVAETDPERIAALAGELRDGERVFAFGVGEDVNTYLLDRLVESGRGSVTYVRPSENVEAAVSSLTRRIGAPVLTDLRIVSAPAPLQEAYPAVLPDLFLGEDLVLLGRYAGEGAGDLVLEGTRGGERQRFAFPVQLPRREGDNAFVSRLWAARKAGVLGAQIRLHGASAELVAQLRELALRYGVLTEYTSYLVLEPGAVAREPEEIGRALRAVAAAPSAQTGAASFEQARASARLNAAQSVAEADAALAAGVEPGSVAAADAAWVRVGRRLFVRRDGAWSDVRSEGGTATIAVAPYSDAWIELLRRLPGLRAAAALGDRVIIAGNALVLRFEPAGRTTLDGADWRRIEQAFAADRQE